MTIQDFSIWYAAARTLLSGQSPYIVHGFVSPVWALIPFIPLTILPEAFAAQVYMLVSFAGMLVAIARLKIPPLFIPIIVLLTPVVWLNMSFANVEWLVLLGATLPPRLGIWLVALKPQMGIGLIILWVLQRRRLKPLLKLIGPLAIALIINFAVLGLPRPLPLHDWSYDLFPWGILIGLMLMAVAIWHHDTGAALASGITFSPYVGITSWAGAIGLARTKRGLAILVAATWAIYLFWRIPR